MHDWAATWGLNGLIFVGFLYVFAFSARKDRRILHIALLVFLGLAMFGTLPQEIVTCR